MKTILLLLCLCLVVTGVSVHAQHASDLQLYWTCVKASTTCYLMDADGGNQKEFLDARTFIREPLFSPDGKHILYSEWTFGPGADDNVAEVVKSRAVVVNLHGQEVRAHVMPIGWAISSKSWMGNKKALLAIHTSEKNTDIFLWDFTPNTPLKNLTNHPGIDWTPDWIEDATLDVSPVKKK